MLHRRPDVDPTVAGGRDTIALRVPAHPLTLAVLDAFDGGIAAPSANRFGHVSPTTAQHVRDDLGDDVDLVLDGGPCTVGVESTIVDLTVEPPSVLRPGGIPLAALEAIVDGPVRGEDTGPRRAPGMLASHYAPRARVELVEETAEAEARAETLRANGVRAGVLDPGPDPDAYARHLYEWLRRADDDGLEVLIVVPPRRHGLGLGRARPPAQGRRPPLRLSTAVESRTARALRTVARDGRNRNDTRTPPRPGGIRRVTGPAG